MHTYELVLAVLSNSLTVCLGASIDKMFSLIKWIPFSSTISCLDKSKEWPKIFLLLHPKVNTIFTETQT